VPHLAGAARAAAAAAAVAAAESAAKLKLPLSFADVEASVQQIDDTLFKTLRVSGSSYLCSQHNKNNNM
jgi:hypothetical protein